MAGPTTASRPCQPTNPPPKCYKPPKMTKLQQSGNPQQQYIDPKIIDSHCRASTQCYVATHGHNSTRTKKPTMILPNTGPHHTIQKNQEKYSTGTVFKKFTTTTENIQKNQPPPCSQPTVGQPQAGNPQTSNKNQLTTHNTRQRSHTPKDREQPANSRQTCN